MDLIARLFPEWALRRSLARLQLQRVEGRNGKRLYEAAQPSIYRKARTDSRSANAVMSHARDALRRQARYLDENHDLAVGVLDTLVDRIVGKGIVVEPMVRKRNGELHYKLNERIAKRWERWTRRPEASRTLPWGEAQRLLCRTWLRDGEALVQHVEGDRTTVLQPGDTPYMLELIEPDLLPFDMNQDSPRIIQGVQVAGWQRPVVYHLYTTHPGEMIPGSTLSNQTKSVSANQVTHLKFVRRLGQIRGVSIFHPVLTRLEDIRDYEESERIAARVAAAFTGYIKRSADFGSQALTPDNERAFEMAPGMIWDNLAPGEEVGTIASNRPNPELANFRAAMLRAVASGTGTNYSSISKHYDGNYSSQRQELVESRMAYDRLRQYFCDVFVAEVYRRFVRLEVAGGDIQPAGVDEDTLFDADYRGPGVPWIDPLKEAEAEALNVKSGFKSRHQVIRDHGDSPAVVDAQLADDDFVPADQVAPPAPAPAAPPTDDTDDETRHLGEHLVRIEAAITQLRSDVDRPVDAMRAYLAGFDTAQREDLEALEDGAPVQLEAPERAEELQDE